MKVRGLQCLLLLALVILLGGAVRNLMASPEVPSIAFIVAALRNQDVSTGKSLEVKYKYWKAGHPENALSLRYVRTPNMQFIASTSASGLVIKNSFDKTRTEYREFVTTCIGTKEGYVDSVTAGVLNSQTTMDTVRRPLDAGTLLDVVSKGTVSSSMEQVGAFSCWRIDSPATPGLGVEKYVIWLDPTVGFCPRKIQICWIKQDRKPKVVEFQDYRELGNGVWFPTQTKILANTPDNGKTPAEFVGDAEFISHVETVQIDAAFTDDELTVQFPSGTQVVDNLRDASYTVP